MRHTACSSHRQMKALFFILLLAGHDAVRVTQEVGWSTSKWNELHAGCSWSLGKGCSEGCVRKRLPLDLTPGASCRHTNAYLLENNGLKNYHTMVEILIEKGEKYGEKCQKAIGWNLVEARKCRRREAQMGEASRFILRAFMNATFTATLDESDRVSLSDGFQKVLKNFARDEAEAESLAELMKKMKCQRSEFLQDPKKVLAEVTRLGRAISSDDLDVKQRAKREIDAMPESCSPVSAEEEAAGLVKLKNLQKESEQEREETLSALDELDATIDGAVEEEADEMESADSALQVSSPDTPEEEKALIDGKPVGPLILTMTITAMLTSVMFIGMAPVGAFFLMGISTWVAFGTIICALRDADHEYAPGEQNCFDFVLLAPLRLVRGLVKGVMYLGKGAAKGAWRGAKGIYKSFKRNTSNTSVLLETEDVMDEPLQAEPLAIDEVSVS